MNVRIYPADFWGPRAGLGLGAGLVGHNLARSHDQWLLTAAPALNEQVATASFASANPRRAQRYVLVSARALHTNADWLGPSSTRTVLERSAGRARVRTGQSLLGRRLLVQPHLAVEHHRVDAVRSPESPPAPGLPPLPSPGSRETGLRVGTDIQFDWRDRPLLPTHGILLQGSWDRYYSLGSSDLSFDQVELGAHGYVPLSGRHRLAFRLSVTTTRPRDTEPPPVYALPTLGGTVVPGWARGRFVGRDRLIAGALYRFPLFRVEELAVVEGHVGVHAGNVYDSIGDQFTTRISWSDPLDSTSENRPLGPSASAGIRFAAPFRPRTAVDMALGLSPEGVTAVRFSFVQSVQSVRPPHHTCDNLR